MSVRTAVPGTLPQAIPKLLRDRAQAHADRVCVAVDGQALTYAEIDARADAIAAGAVALGVRKGDRVATLAPNRIELLELFFGLARAGAIQVPLNAFLKGEFLRHQLAQARASTLITDASGRDALAPLHSELPELRTVVMLDEPIAEEVGYQQLATAAGAPPDVQLDPSDTVSIVYTSGTTGLPKGCVASHGYYHRSCRLLGEALEVTDDDVLYGALPLFHTSALFASVVMPLLFGVPSYIQRTFSARRFFADARECGATVTAAVGSMGLALLSTEPGLADRDHRLRKFMCAPLSLEAQQALRDRFGVEPWVDFYGQSECMPVTITPWSSDQRDPAGCGLPAPDLQVVLLDDDGCRIEGDAIGEICLRPNAQYAMFDGYYGQPEATLEAIKDLWYHTGDYGRRLPTGAIAFVDRKRDALRRRGENIASVEVEASINAHPDILESAVHAVPSELTEDDIKACIVLTAGATLTPEQLFAYFKDRLPYFAIPRYVEVIDALPRNAVGRVMKHKLREAGNNPDTWDLDTLGFTIQKNERR
jgi:crotonobetaine/carnitine-CoA ligase